MDECEIARGGWGCGERERERVTHTGSKWNDFHEEEVGEYSEFNETVIARKMSSVLGQYRNWPM